MVKENYNLIVIVLAISLVRLFSLYINLDYIDLYMDESYYWGWAQSFDFGYYSKPPMIAWLIMVTTSIFGDSELGVKIGSLFVYPLTTMIVYLIAKELFDKRVAFYSALLFFTLPAVWLSSIIISTDVVLLFFWSCSILFFVRATKRDKVSYWILAGFCAGLGLLSKYNMVFFVLSVLIIFAINKEYRHYLRDKRLYIAILVAFITFLPNLYWQYTHQFVSFEHTSEISQIDRELFHISKMFEFLSAQFFVFGPIVFFIFITLIYKYKSLINSQKILFWFSIPFLAIITTLSLLSRAFANWAAPTYIGASILVVSYLVMTKREHLIKLSIIIHSILALIIYFYNPILNTLNIQLSSKKYNPSSRVMGWEDAGREISSILTQYPNTKLLFNSRVNMAQFTFYISPHPFDAVMFNPQNIPLSQYHISTNLNNHKGESFVLIVDKNHLDKINQYFDETTKIAQVSIKLYGDFAREFDIYYLTNFKGY